MRKLLKNKSLNSLPKREILALKPLDIILFNEFLRNLNISYLNDIYVKNEYGLVSYYKLYKKLHYDTRLKIKIHGNVSDEYDYKLIYKVVNVFVKVLNIFKLGIEIKWLAENNDKNIKLYVLYLLYINDFPRYPFSFQASAKITYHKRMSRVLSRLKALELINKKEGIYQLTNLGIKVCEIIFQNHEELNSLKNYINEKNRYIFYDLEFRIIDTTSNILKSTVKIDDTLYR